MCVPILRWGRTILMRASMSKMATVVVVVVVTTETQNRRTLNDKVFSFFASFFSSFFRHQAYVVVFPHWFVVIFLLSIAFFRWNQIEILRFWLDIHTHTDTPIEHTRTGDENDAAVTAQTECARENFFSFRNVRRRFRDVDGACSLPLSPPPFLFLPSLVWRVRSIYLSLKFRRKKKKRE